MYRSLPIIAFSAAILATGQAYASMPVFSAECPQGNYIDADRSGTVRVNGAVAQLEKFNDQYYEARQGGVTYSISHEADGSGLQVSYNPPGSAGGYCTIMASTSSGASSQPSGAGETRTVQVSFPSGMSGTELQDSIAPGGSVRYVLNAQNGQDLYVRVAGQGLSYQIFNPDNSFLLDQVSASQEYRGQLWQSGNHVIEIINRSNQTQSYNVIFGIN